LNYGKNLTDKTSFHSTIDTNILLQWKVIKYEYNLYVKIMNSSKYDESSYIKYPKLNISGASFTPLEDKMIAGNLMIKWHCIKATSEQNKTELKGNIITFNGICEKRVKTPIGELFPQQYPLKIAVGNNKFIEPLQLLNVDYEYSLYFQNPPNVQMSQVEVWEFKG
jgi:hypothetical protein